MVAMWRLGRSRGQRLVRLRPVKAIASARKFDEHGDWHYFALVARAIPWLFGNRGPADRIADRYWYGDRRRYGSTRRLQTRGNGAISPISAEP